MPKLNELHATYEDQGLVLIGVHTTRGGETMAAFVDKVGIKYPVAIDIGSKTVGAFGVNGYPDYYVIDRAGNMRVADLANDDVERTIKILLTEPPPVAPVLAKASAKALQKDKRILVVWGSESDRGPVDTALKSGRALSKLIFNEYEVVRIERAKARELAKTIEAGADGAALAVLDAGGNLLARYDGDLSSATELSTFLKAQRVPQKDAEVLWTNALAEATRENKRILVHLGAPW